MFALLFDGEFLWPCYSPTYRPGGHTTAFSLDLWGCTHFNQNKQPAVLFTDRMFIYNRLLVIVMKTKASTTASLPFHLNMVSLRPRSTFNSPPPTAVTTLRLVLQAPSLSSYSTHFLLDCLKLSMTFLFSTSLNSFTHQRTRPTVLRSNLPY